MNKKIIGPTLIAALLAGCASQPSANDILKDDRGYLTRTMTVDQLPSDIRGDVAKLESVDLPFHTLIFDVDTTMRKTDFTAATTSEATEHNRMTFINAGGGNIQVTNDITSNGIPTKAYLYLSYVNFTSYEDETVDVDARRPPQIVYWHNINSITPGLAHPQENASYSVEKKGNGFTELYACTTDTLRPASTLLEKLPGQALGVVCTSSRDGIVNNRDKMVFLTAYGIYFRTEKDFRNYVYTFNITDVHLE